MTRRANARCLIEAVRQIAEPRHICLEEGTLSGWLHRCCRRRTGLTPPNDSGRRYHAIEPS